VSPPELSVILVTDRFSRIRATVRHLRAQQGHERIELVIVTASEEELDLEAAEVAGLGGVRVVAIGRLQGYGHGVARGVGAAGAPIVALGETHSFPQPGWVEALIGRHSDSCAAVGPVVEGANPAGGPIARSNLLLDYGPWLRGVAGGPVEALPGHNSSYKRDLLTGYGEELEVLMEAEFLLHASLRERGEQLYLEPAARTRHLQVNTLSMWPRERFAAGRAFSHLRARGWSRRRRALYLAAGPLIVPVRMRRILAGSRAAGTGGESLATLGALVLGLVVQTAGEMAGLVAASGRVRALLWEIELKRIDYASEADRAELLRAA
jgi:hypothetical protein